MYLIGVYLMGMYLIGVHLMGVYFIGIYIMGVYVMDVTDAKGLARQLQQVHYSAHSCLKYNINSINQ
jgi:hypothetical protein